MHFKNKLIACVLSLSSISAFAEGMISNFTNKVSDEWNKSMNGNSEIYIPFHAWHNRDFYEDTSRLNENTWGLGYGRSYLDEDKDYHGFYVMGFKDSNYDLEPLIGYSYTKNWYKENAFVGIGFTAFLTARSDSSYVPIPGILPVATVGYKDIKFSATYIPIGGTANNKKYGNIAFFWSTITF